MGTCEYLLYEFDWLLSVPVKERLREGKGIVEAIEEIRRKR